MSAAETQAEAKPAKKRFDLKYWMLALLVLAAMTFNVTERLLLDADEADISLDRLIVKANRITNPDPGDVFVFNHRTNRFVESKFCQLQIFTTPEPVTDQLKVSNLWGSSLNAALASVENYIPKMISGMATVDQAEHGWTYAKLHRNQIRAPMEPECLESVVAAVLDPMLTPFVVDAIYRVETSDGDSEWVRFANPLILDPATCGGQCPAPADLVQIVDADRFTRLKAQWGIVHFE
ncbi:MAG: hypothetical protein AAF636_11320 [Pseudomonadota bacterium]